MTNHSIEQIAVKCEAVGAIIKRLREAKKEGEAYELLCFLIDSLDQQWQEIKREESFAALMGKAEATRQCGACGGPRKKWEYMGEGC
jgi:hypothetical protein